MIHHYPQLFHLRSRMRSLQDSTRLQFLQFPAQALLTTSQPNALYPFILLQTLTRLRPDIRFSAISPYWKKQNLPPADAAQLSQDPTLSTLPDSIKLTHYWMKGLEEKSRQGISVILAAAPAAPDPGLSFYTQRFLLTPALSPLPQWAYFHYPYHLSFYDSKPLPEPALPRPINASRIPLAAFGNEFNLLTVSQAPPLRGLDIAIFKLALTWQIAQPLPHSHYLLNFWITPSGTNRPVMMLNFEKRLWKDTRHLGSGLALDRLPARATFEEIYQLPVPALLEAGSYLVRVSILDVRLDRPLLVRDRTEAAVEFAPVMEFRILPEASKSTPNPGPPLAPTVSAPSGPTPTYAIPSRENNVLKSPGK
jgi:hypothetical protein